VDFYYSEQAVVMEVDGNVHGVTDRILRDQEREQDLQSLGLRIIRYPNDDMMNNVEGVLEDLSHRLLSGSTSPHPSLQRRGIEVPKD
jgi:cyclase